MMIQFSLENSASEDLSIEMDHYRIPIGPRAPWQTTAEPGDIDR